MERMRILIADRDDSFRKSISEILAKSGCLVIGEAADGLATLKKARSLQPEVVLISTELPVMSGVEVAKIIQEAKLSAVVLIADYSGKEYLKDDKWIGPVLVKPFDEFQLLSILEYSYAAFNKMVDLENEIRRLRNDLETRKVIEKAKGIMMKKYGLTEEASFKRIQQQSMKNRTTMKKVAQAVIMANEMGE